MDHVTVESSENECKSEEIRKEDRGIKKSSDSELESEIFDYNLKYETQLQDKPDVLAFITRLQKYIKKQEKKIKKLKSSLKRYRTKKATKDVSTQIIDPANDFTEDTKSVEPKTLTEEIKEAAENAMHQTGFVYEATSGMYYDYNTGYYYNAELGLYYDGNNGKYLIYNSETQTYDFHSKVDTVSTESLQPDNNGKRKKRDKEQDGKRAKMAKIVHLASGDAPLEEGECSNSESEADSKASEKGFSSSDEQDCVDISKSWPPCMRVILKETTLEKIKIGSLFIVTCDGGTVGREGDHAILIPDINVSKHHAKITFDRETRKYLIVDLGSRNGTLLNGKRISASKQESEPQEVLHGSTIQIGASKLLCHIHDGQKTCGHCEPGLIQTTQSEVKTEISVPRSTQHKKELRRLRKKFGLEAQDNSNSELAPGYSDRAHTRRKTVGSHDHNEKTQVASVNQSIASDNKGFKMLSKMGWAEGQSLGKEGFGLTEPVPLISNEGRTGLGSAESVPTLDKTAEKKHIKWKKAQQRYQKVKDITLDAFKVMDSDEES